jgi:hypothetical protein
VTALGTRIAVIAITHDNTAANDRAEDCAQDRADA